MHSQLSSSFCHSLNDLFHHFSMPESKGHEFKGSCQKVCDTDILKHDHGSFISAETQKNATPYQHQLTRY